ncbi:hypothetical protein NDU88_005193 [Pleurodeles waltl]|uniref:Uncharacterized protein n=1 Tax=Pleurodeles waltl TaxID=8319 RepID=A0AAV7V3W1_PLEWA|nr:hypothetical protein NDU88_005193 [Pleurodeles waltl]
MHLQQHSGITYQEADRVLSSCTSSSIQALPTKKQSSAHAPAAAFWHYLPRSRQRAQLMHLQQHSGITYQEAEFSSCTCSSIQALPTKQQPESSAHASPAAFRHYLPRSRVQLMHLQQHSGITYQEADRGLSSCTSSSIQALPTKKQSSAHAPAAAFRHYLSRSRVQLMHLRQHSGITYQEAARELSSCTSSGIQALPTKKQPEGSARAPPAAFRHYLLRSSQRAQLVHLQQHSGITYQEAARKLSSCTCSSIQALPTKKQTEGSARAPPAAFRHYLPRSSQRAQLMYLQRHSGITYQPESSAHAPPAAFRHYLQEAARELSSCTSSNIQALPTKKQSSAHAPPAAFRHYLPRSSQRAQLVHLQQHSGITYQEAAREFSSCTSSGIQALPTKKQPESPARAPPAAFRHYLPSSSQRAQLVHLQRHSGITYQEAARELSSCTSSSIQALPTKKQSSAHAPPAAFRHYLPRISQRAQLVHLQRHSGITYQEADRGLSSCTSSSVQALPTKKQTEGSAPAPPAAFRHYLPRSSQRAQLMHLERHSGITYQPESSAHAPPAVFRHYLQ